MERVTFASLRKRAVALVIAGLGAAVAGLVSLSLALYEAANPKPLPQVAAGEPIDTGRWTVVLGAATFHEAEAGGPARNKLAIDVEVTNRSASTSNSFVNLLAIEQPPDGLDTPSFYLARDRTIASGLHPDMPERLVAMWDWPEGTPPPQSLRLDVAGQIHKRRDNLYGAPGWFDRPPVAAVTLPVSTGASQDAAQ